MRQYLMGHVESDVLRLQPGGVVLGLITAHSASRHPSPLERLAEDQAGELGIGLAAAEGFHLPRVGLQQRLHDGGDQAQTALLQLLRQDHPGDLAAPHTSLDQLHHLCKLHAVVAMV